MKDLQLTEHDDACPFMTEEEYRVAMERIAEEIRPTIEENILRRLRSEHAARNHLIR